MGYDSRREAGPHLVRQVVLPHAENTLVGFFPCRKGGEKELWIKREECVFFIFLIKSVTLTPDTHLLGSGADLQGVGNPASSFLSGDVDHVSKSQRDLR